MSMLFDAVFYHRGPNHLLLACWVQRRRAFLGLSTDQAAVLAGLQVSEWGALVEGWVPDEPAIRAIAATLQVGWPEVSLVAEITRYNAPAVA